MATGKEILDIGGRQVTITNPDKVYFPTTGHTKLDLVRYYLAVAEGALVGVAGRPMALKRYVNGVEGEAFYQKRAPKNRPEWLETVQFRYPSGGVADELVLRDAAAVAWVVNLGCVDLHPHPVRADDLAHPDELRVDLDPIPGVPWSQVRQVAMVVREVLDDVGLAGWPKTCGARRTWPPAGGGRRSGRACSWTTTRTPRTTPPRRSTRSARPPTRGCPPRCTGTRCPTACRRPTPSRRSGPGTPRWATPAPGSTSGPARWSRCWRWPSGTRRRGWPTRRGPAAPPTRSARPGGASPACR